MSLKKRIGIVVMVAAVTLGVLVGVQYGWNKYMLQDPALEKLSAVEGVESVKIIEAKPQPVIEISLKAVPNLKNTSRELSKIAGTSKLMITDNRTPELQALLEKIRFNIEEAIVQGNFTEMDKAVAAAAHNAKLDNYGLYMDEDAIYLQFHKGGHALYQVFPRQQEKLQTVQIVTKE